ncbi:putative leucine-rich repeat-containing protein DDB_G0290503 [Battus philenor]|uniref:putative leucine-rich repeat-containing protein DDB_G0290503 n=1 Tax=Battus philenor TaxID=42288 RepID=UPI0035D0CA11
MAQVEPMNIDAVDDEFDNKENSLRHSNVLPWTPCAEKGYEELDASEMNMKLRYSLTPTSSPMSKSLTSNFCDNEVQVNNMIHENNDLTRSLNSTGTKSDPIRLLKSLPLQTISRGQVGENKSSSVLCLLNSKPEDNNVTVTVSELVDNVEDNSLSGASSVTHTPEAVTPTKEIPKHDGGSPIIRGLKSVLNMFRSSQSPLPPPENKQVSQMDISFNEQSSNDTPDCITVPIVASTPITSKHREGSGSRRSSPLKGCVVFNEDLERELQWKDETTILFKDEKIPIHKLFPPHFLPSKEEKRGQLNSSREFKDISSNDSIFQNKVITQVVPLSDSLESVAMESDGEFVDCETTVNDELWYNKSAKGESENLIGTSLQQQKLLLVNIPCDSLQPVNANEVTIDSPLLSADINQTSNMLQARPEVTDISNETSTDQKLVNSQLNNRDENCSIINATLCKEREKECITEVQTINDLPLLQNYNVVNTNNEIQHDQNSENKLNIILKNDSEFTANISCIVSEDISGIHYNSSKQNVEIINPSEVALPDEDQVEYIINSEKAVDADPYSKGTSIDMNHTMSGIEKKQLVGHNDLPEKCIDESIQEEEGGNKEFNSINLNQTIKQTSSDFIYNNEIKISNHEDELNENGTGKHVRNQIIEKSDGIIVENKNNIEINSEILDKHCIKPIDLNVNEPCKILCEHIENESEQSPKEVCDKDCNNMLDKQCKTVNTGENITSSSNKSEFFNKEALRTAVLEEQIDFEFANTSNIILKSYDKISLQAPITFEIPDDSTEQKKCYENVQVIEEQKGIDLVVPDYDLCLDETKMLQSDNIQQTDLHDHDEIKDLPILNKSSDECKDISRAETEYKFNLKSSIHDEVVFNVTSDEDVKNQPDYLLDSHQKEHCEDDSERFLHDNLHPALNSTTHTANKIQLQDDKEKRGDETQISTSLNSSLKQNHLHVINAGIDSAHDSKMLYSSETQEVVSDHPLIYNNIIQNEKAKNLQINIEPVGTAMAVKLSPTPSPDAFSKECNLNFDEMDDPFATKSKIRMSPPPPNSSMSASVEQDDVMIKPLIPEFALRKRKSQLDNEERNVKDNINPIFSGASNTQQKTISDNKNTDISANGDLDLSLKTTALDREKDALHKTIQVSAYQTERTLEMENDKDLKSAETEDNTKLNNIHAVNATEEEKKLTCNERRSELDAIIAIENSETRNVFNLPEMSGIFIPKSKICETPPNEIEEKLGCEFEFPANNLPLNNLQIEKVRREQSADKNDNTTTSFSSLSPKDDAVACEGNTEDEDTVEGPFFESEQSSSAEKNCVRGNKIQLSDVSAQGIRNNADNEEMFIDAETYEFLLNQNKYNVVEDSGKESLFLKFDPLFAKRVSSDGVSAILNKIQTRQSTLETISQTPSTGGKCYERGAISPSHTEIDVDIPNPMETSFEDPNVIVTKPMMVVNPAINSVVSPRNTSYTPPRTNRRSLTFTSPAIAVIDRLLSLSGSNSPLNHETTFVRARIDTNDTDQALTQLRELLAEKEIQVHNLRLESKELKDRLCALESHVKNLESQGEQKLRRINELNDSLCEKNKINKSMAAVLEEYERTMASLIAEIEQDKKSHAQERLKLKNERNEQAAHLASMELAFNDLHSKYEKSKQIILSYKAKEDAYVASLKQTEENFLKMQNNYELLKQHATSTLNRANQELELLSAAHDAEMLKLNAMVKRKDVDISSLKETLAQKSKTNEELTALCDELIRKVS